MTRRQTQPGFTLVEMIIVMVITGIIGGMVAIFLRAPVQQYMSTARRADMTDIADTALRRIGRDLRLALPNSVRVNTSGSGATTIYYLDFWLPAVAVAIARRMQERRIVRQQRRRMETD